MHFYCGSNSVTTTMHYFFSSGVIASFADKTGGKALRSYRLFLPFSSHYLLRPLPRTVPNSKFTSAQTRCSIESRHKGTPRWSPLTSQSELTKKNKNNKKRKMCVFRLFRMCLKKEKEALAQRVALRRLKVKSRRWVEIKVLEHFLISSFYSLR